MRYVSVRDFKGKTLVDIREYWMNGDGEMKPGKKGTYHIYIDILVLSNIRIFNRINVIVNSHLIAFNLAVLLLLLLLLQVSL